MELNKIHNVDCLQGMKQLPNDSVDCIITDPPYGDNSAYGRMDKTIKGNEQPLLNCQILHEAQRVLKKDKTIYNFTNWKHYPFLTEFIQRYTCFKIRQMIVCSKNHFGMGYGFRNQHELIIVLEKGQPSYNTSDFGNVIEFRVEKHDESTHPHKKPEILLRRLIKHSTQEGDVVFDPTVGSGSTAIAAKQLNRQYIGFEIDEDWVVQANKRLTQNTLFNLNDFMEEDKNESKEEIDRSIEGQGTESQGNI